MSEPKPKRIMSATQKENLRLGREKAHARMRNLKVEAKELKQFKAKQEEPQEYNAKYDEEKVVYAKDDILKAPPPKPVPKPVSKREINLEKKRVQYEAKLMKAEYDQKMKAIGAKPITSPVQPDVPKPAFKPPKAPSSLSAAVPQEPPVREKRSMVGGKRRGRKP
jgi:hypothetical protein